MLPTSIRYRGTSYVLAAASSSRRDPPPCRNCHKWVDGQYHLLGHRCLPNRGGYTMTNWQGRVVKLLQRDEHNRVLTVLIRLDDGRTIERHVDDITCDP